MFNTQTISTGQNNPYGQHGYNPFKANPQSNPLVNRGQLGPHVYKNPYMKAPGARPYNGPGGSNNSGMGSGGGAMGQTMPDPVFGNVLTNQMINQGWEQAFTNSDPNYLSKQFTQPGVSHSAGTMAGIMPQISANIAGANALQNTLPLEHQMLNAQMGAQNQYDNGQNMLGNMNILRQLQNQQWNQQSQLMNAMSPLFASLFQ